MTSQSSPKGARLPVLAAAINCCPLHPRRSLTAEVSLCTEKNVVITTIDFLSQAGALQQCRFVLLSIFFSVHPLADVRRTVLKLHSIRLATPKKPHGVAIRQPHVSQIQNDVSVVAIKKLFQFHDVLRFHTPT
jgi:hypothetical protein